MFRLILFSLILVINGSLLFSQTSSVFPMKVAASGRYFLNASNKPHFLKGDTPWQLIVDLSEEEAKYYFRKRMQQGFNSILVDMLSEEANIVQKQCGCTPFSGTDFADINEQYFDNALKVVNIAREHGFLVLCTVAYWGCCDDNNGWRNEIEASNDSSINIYGAYLGRKFMNCDNLVWVLGGDNSTGRERYDIIKRAIRNQNPSAIFTYHTREDELASDLMNDLDIDAVYAYYREKTYELTQKGYLLSTKPVIFLEGFYDKLEGTNFRYEKWDSIKVSMTMRQQMYWFLLSGGLGGFINGHIELWGFPEKWKEMLETRNTKSIQVFNELVQELEWWNLVPNFPDSSDTIIIKGRGEYGSPGYIPVSLTKDNRKMIAYIPSNHTGEFTIDYRRFSLKPGQGFWINPATGEKCNIQALPSDGHFKIPKDRGDMINDWVLVLQTLI